MNLFENFLNNTANHYYPKDLNEVDELYYNSKERKMLLKLREETWNLNKEPLHIFKNDMSFLFDKSKIMINQGVHSGSSHVIQILTEKNNIFCKVIVIYISFMIPYYHIVSLNSPRNAYSITSDLKILEELDEIIKVKMFKIFNYHKFPTRYINYEFPELIVRENFTALQAFFTEYYLMNHDFLNISKR